MAKLKYNWPEIQKFYDDGHTIHETAHHFGMKAQNLSKSRFFKSRSKAEQRAMGVSTRRERGNLGHSDATKTKLSDIAIERGFGGKNYRKTYYYNDVILESSYELAVAQSLDDAGVTWTRPKFLPWIDSEGKNRRYTPDFYLPEYDVYLDPKNEYLIGIDLEKIKICSDQNCVKIIVLAENQLTWESIKELLQG